MAWTRRGVRISCTPPTLDWKVFFCAARLVDMIEYILYENGEMACFDYFFSRFWQFFSSSFSPC
ncbi:hypothetical protein IJG96_02810, partial [Candidatus Saccharibacteria bacterium]|nr:hypothetical protein [Candidatus Saccharibacteria bacterium]